MALTRKLKETVQLRVKQDPEYRKELIIEATNTFLDSDISTGKTLLRDYLNATEALPYTTAFVESTINQVACKRMVKKQQMRWSQRGAYLLLQVRTRVLNDELREQCQQWYTRFVQQEQHPKAA